jgi:hypothetical protein
VARNNFHPFTSRPHADKTVAELGAAIRQVEAELAELRPQAKAARKEVEQAEARLGPGWNPFGRTPAEIDLHLLGLGEGATREDLQKAYRQRAKDAHPDRGGPAWMMDNLAQAKERLEECLPTDVEKEAERREQEERKKVPWAVREDALRAAKLKAQSLDGKIRRREGKLHDLKCELRGRPEYRAARAAALTKACEEAARTGGPWERALFAACQLSDAERDRLRRWLENFPDGGRP